MQRLNEKNGIEYSLNVTLTFTVSPSSMQANQFVNMYANNNQTITNDVPLGFSCLIDPSLIQITGKNISFIESIRKKSEFDIFKFLSNANSFFFNICYKISTIQLFKIGIDSITASTETTILPNTL